VENPVIFAAILVNSVAILTTIVGGGGLGSVIFEEGPCGG
jgi:ABC-type proline/glycine betaine transport system permease subunit